jgi:hypothetical protein
VSFVVVFFFYTELLQSLFTWAHHQFYIEDTRLTWLQVNVNLEGFPWLHYPSAGPHAILLRGCRLHLQNTLSTSFITVIIIVVIVVIII